VEALVSNENNGISEIDNWSGAVDAEALPSNLSFKPIEHTTDDPPCSRILDDLAVLPDGKVRVCSCRYAITTFDELVIGDLNEQPMSRILYGDKHKELIKRVASGDWPDVCRTCTLYKPIAYTPERWNFLAAAAVRTHNVAASTTSMTERDTSPNAEACLVIGRALKARGAVDEATHEFYSAYAYAAEQLAKIPQDQALTALLAEIAAELS
jgi:radical SAM protein with 4Fe4S-binding SPASM domain